MSDAWLIWVPSSKLQSLDNSSSMLKELPDLTEPGLLLAVVGRLSIF